MKVLVITESAFVIIDYESYRALSSDPLTIEALKRNPGIARHYGATILDNTGDEAEIPPVMRRSLSVIIDYR